MVVCHLPYGPTAYFGIFNTVLRHDIGEKKEVGAEGQNLQLLFPPRQNAPPSSLPLIHTFKLSYVFASLRLPEPHYS